MPGFAALLRDNRNYRFTWLGQIVSEIGDHFNNIAVFSLALKLTGSGMAVSGVMLARAGAMIAAGPLAGVLLDRMDRKRIMIASDLVRAVVAACFVLAIHETRTWPLYALSALLMFASPFFTSGRSAILPVIASRQELHAANSLTQATQWTSLTVGTLLAGGSVTQFGYRWAFAFNAISFLFSALCIGRLRAPGGFQAERRDLSEDRVLRPWHEYREGLRYMRREPLVFAIALVGVGWATGGGAAQILFSLFGDTVFGRGAAGIGTIWGCAGIGLLIGAAVAHWFGRGIAFDAYKRTISICYVVHGGAYVLFSQMTNFTHALVFIAISRAAVAVSSVMNQGQLLRHVADEYRGRVFSTMESMIWATMMLSMTLAGLASDYASPRALGAAAGVFSSSTAIFWAWANWRGKLPEPARRGVEPEEVEVHGDPTAA